MKNKYDTIFYVLLLTIILWILLKMSGVINTPGYVELYPILAGAIAAGVAYGKFSTSQRHIEFGVDKLDYRAGKLEKITSLLNTRITKVETILEMLPFKKLKRKKS